MNSWLKGILAASLLVCVLSFSILGWLAVQTTEPTAAAKKQNWTPVFGSERTADKSNRNTSLDEVAINGAIKSINDLVDRLKQINKMSGVVPNELLLSFKSEQAMRDFIRDAEASGLKVLHSDPRLLSARVGFDDAEQMARALSRNAQGLDQAGLNYVAWIPGLPDTTSVDAANAGGTVPYGNSGLEAIGAGLERENWGRGLKVAVLDTGVMDHPILEKSRVTHTDLVNDGEAPNGHGTAMATLIAGSDAAAGGVAPAAQILDIRVADGKGESNTALVAQGIMMAVDAGAKVINISLGTTADSPILHKAITYAQENGVVVVAAAGNEQQTALAYPAAYAGVISVGAVDANGTQAYFSNSGEGLVIAAPGVGIVSGYSDQRMVMSSGTSQATALTSGVVTTMLGWGYSGKTIVESLTRIAQPTGAPVNQVGAGIVQLPKR